MRWLQQPIQRRSREGQAAVLIALVTFSLVIFLALATNVGILVNDRIRMQNAADLGAYAAAYKEAQLLNVMVKKNEEILRRSEECRRLLTEVVPVWTGEICLCEPINFDAEALIDDCEDWIDDAAENFMDAANWTASVQPALEAGKKTMGANIKDLERNSGTKMFDGSNSSSMQGAFQAVKDGPISGRTVDAIANYEQVPDTLFNYRVLVMCPYGPSGSCIPWGIQPSDPREVASWFIKDGRDPDIWVMSQAAGTMASQYLDIAYSSGGSDGGYFGGSSTGEQDTMYAIAVAKPYGGSVGPTRVSSSPTQVNGNSSADQGVYVRAGMEFPKLAMIEKYRARLAGTGEWGSSGVSPLGALQADGQWEAYVSNFKH
jgi:hypothetical protein